MTKKHPISKEMFVAPKVTQVAGVELEDSLLANSPGKDMASLIIATGHDRYEYDVDYNGDYWE